MAPNKRHAVTLLAPSGREQPVALVVAKDGVHLTTVEGKEINTFAYETIRKWLPSHLRSKNPGPDDCLDLQIETDKGPRDLRMRCGSSLAVKQLMKDLRDTVETIMREMDDQQIQQQQELERQSQPVQEAPIASAAPPTLSSPAAGPGSFRSEPALMSHSHAETQTLRDADPAGQQHRQRREPGASPSRGPSPLLVHGPAGGVAQLFVAHPTGIALPVGSRGVATPALMEGLQQATAAASLLPASGTFAYEYLDAYGVAGGAEGELEVTDRAASTAPGFFNAMFHQARAGLPGYGVPPPQSPPLSPGIGAGSTGSGGGYYQQPYEGHQQYVQAAPPPPPPVVAPQAAYAQQAYYPAAAAPQPQAPALPPQQMQAQQPYPPVPPAYQQTPQQPAYQAPVQQTYQQVPQQPAYQPSPPQQAYPQMPPMPPMPPPPPLQYQSVPPYQPEYSRGGSKRERGRSAGRPVRRSDPDPTTSPVRRRVEFSGISGSRRGFRSEDDEGVGERYLSPYHDAHCDAEGDESGGSAGSGGSGSGGGSGSSGEFEDAPADGPAEPAMQGGGAEGDLQLQVRFLEDLVARLSAEVSRRAVSPERAAAAAMALAGAADAPPSPPPPFALPPVAAAPVAATPAAAPPAAPEAPPAIDYEALLNADALGAAAVLRDQKLLAPLLAAYDTRIEQLEADLRSRTEQLQAFKGQVDEVVEENDRLRSDLAAAVEQRNAAQAAASSAAAAVAAANDAAAAAAAAGAGSSEELELLRRENELLVAQQSELDAEIQRLHKQLQERAQEVIRAGQEQAALAQQAQQAAAKTQEAEVRSTKLTEALRALEAKAAALSAQSARNKAAADEAANELANTRAALEELRLVHSQVQAEAAAAQQRYKAAADGAASLQLELSTQREKSDALQGQVLALNRECDTLRSALGGVESKLTELQRRDADVWTRVKEAMSTAEEARLARDSALSRCADLERQVEIANTRLTTARQATRDAVADEFNAQLTATQAATAQVREELAAANIAVSEWRARAERLERDQASLTSELAALREDTAAALASKSRLGLASLGAVEKAATLERERDEAVAKLESAQRKAERAARDAQLERQSTENQIRGLKSTIAELEANLGAVRAEAGTARRQVEAVSRELAASKAARQQAETELRQAIAAARTEREGELRAMAAKMESQAAAAAAAATEAERLLNSKQELLARWREEAQTLASRMEAALSDHKREMATRAHEASELRSRCEALAAENVELAATISELEAKIDDLNGHLTEAEIRADGAAAQVMAASNRETELQSELRQLQMVLDRAHFEKSRIQRAHDPLTAKYDALKKDIRQATVGPSTVGVPAALPTPGTAVHTPGAGLHLYGHVGGVGMGWSGSPDGVVHASRVQRSGVPTFQHAALAPGR